MGLCLGFGCGPGLGQPWCLAMALRANTFYYIHRKAQKSQAPDRVRSLRLAQCGAFPFRLYHSQYCDYFGSILKPAYCQGLSNGRDHLAVPGISFYH